ncbi:hypothetical protein H310_08239 [Aphanomyces invadans]|uniref:Uncharacterized protein n=1 Tax=Aphanomyces invadans TaxID=157072 RepID=A0A024U104_9STRA|nr:hypothetical protein H310_08239 [Aphanomyces invadans]ETV99586.1 hypothetical protein H310_08239 [Aphanomyces invadans]|eukprot:XP_008872142.1 hypothetical protein H310_08239 [Aphanomyces invadans]
MNQTTSHCSRCCSHTRAHASPAPPSPPSPPTPPQPTYVFGQHRSESSPSAAARAHKKGQFVTSAIVGFVVVLLLKNLFVLTSIVGVVFLALMGLGSHGVIRVDFKKAVDMCSMQDLPSLSVVPSKPGFIAGAAVAWHVWP